jgi:hypothetical protein
MLPEKLLFDDVSIKYKNNGIVKFITDIKLTPNLHEKLPQV